MRNSALHNKIKILPMLPGCYLFFNKHQDIIYIGKSKALKKRITQHLSNSSANKEGKYKNMYREIVDVEFIVTVSETEALILECALIKRYKPWYNTQLVRKKQYPFLKINLNVKYPTISICTTGYTEEKNCRYFGSFYSEDDALATIELFNKIWRTQCCNRNTFKKNHKPCLHYHIGRCCGPCTAVVNENEYRSKIDEIINCLNGNIGKTEKRLKNEMVAAADRLAFEKAEELKNLIGQLNNLKKKSNRLHTQLKGKQYILFFSAYHEQCATVFYLEDGSIKYTTVIEDKYHPQQQQFDDFIDKIKTKEYQPDKRYVAQHLLEISADKYFFCVTEDMDMKALKLKLMEAYKEYIE